MPNSVEIAALTASTSNLTKEVVGQKELLSNQFKIAKSAVDVVVPLAAQTAADKSAAAASAELAQQISGLDTVDSAVALAITPYEIETHKKALESASGGKNTVMIDEQSNINVMVWVPAFNREDANAAILARLGVDLQLGTGLHSAFVTNGVTRKGFWRAKYAASAGANGGCSAVAGVTTKTSVDYDTASELCNNKGPGWHLTSIHEDAASSIWAFANNTEPRGNTNYGRSHKNKIEVGRRGDNAAPGDTAGTALTDTGTGPVTWAHDHTSFGLHDLVGNVREWLGQMKLSNGQIVSTLDNDPIIAELDWYNHSAYFDATSANGGAPVLSNEVINRNGAVDGDANSGDYATTPHFAAITKSAGYNPSELLRQLLIESASTTNVDGALYVRNYGDRVPQRGGDWSSGSDAGLGSLDLYSSRSYADRYIGFRPAFFE